MKTTTNILKTLTLIIVAILVGVSTTYALGTLQPSSAPADTQYSLNDLYTKLTDFSATTTEDTGDITIPGSITTSFHTLAEIYGLMEDEESDLIPGNIADGVTVFGVEGTLAGAPAALEWSADDVTSGYADWNTAVSACDALTEGGATAGDWRLPTYTELIDASLSGENPVSGFQSDYYWSGTECSFDSDYAWIVLMQDGYSYYDVKTNPYTFARCVR